MPWKPVMTATSPSAKRRLISLPSIPEMRAEPCAAEVVTGILPALPGARLQAHRLQHDREETGRHLLARGDDGVILARVVQDRGLAHPGDELVGHAGHGGDDDSDLVAAVDLPLHVTRDVADALDVGDRGAAELHHNHSHKVSRRALRECVGVGLKGRPPQTGEPGPKGLQTAMSEQKSRYGPFS